MKRLLLLSLIATCWLGAGAQAEKEWALVEPESGETVLMSSVGFLLASDSEETFAVVCNDGRIIGGARSVSFTQIDPTSIEGVKADGGRPEMAISTTGRLRLTGCKEGTAVAVYDTGGRLVRSVVAAGGDVSVDVSDVPAGVYVLRAGKAAVKFTKK